MIAAKLIFQCITGATLLGGVAAGSYFMIDTKEDKYLLVTSVTETTSTTDIDLWTESTTNVIKSSNTDGSVVTPVKKDLKTQKNYKCEIAVDTNKQNDESCLLYSITFDNKKSIDLTTLKAQAKTTQLVKEKTALTNDKYYLLNVSKDLYEKSSFEATKNIKLLLNSDTTKSYATLTVHAKINGNNVSTKTDLFLVKPTTKTEVQATETSKTYSCKFEDSTTAATTCTIYSFTNGTLENNKTLKDLEWSTLTIPSSPTTAITFDNKKYYVIKWDSQTISNSKNKKIIFSESTTVSGTAAKSSDLSLVTPIIRSLPASTPETIILK